MDAKILSFRKKNPPPVENEIECIVAEILEEELQPLVDEVAELNKELAELIEMMEE